MNDDSNRLQICFQQLLTKYINRDDLRLCRTYTVVCRTQIRTGVKLLYVSNDEIPFRK